MIDKIKLNKIREKKQQEKLDRRNQGSIGELKQLEMELANKELQRVQLQEKLNAALQRIEELEKPKTKGKKK